MTDNRDEVEEYNELINETVDDGSGCAELWENLSQTRRKFLKSSGVALGASGMAGMASAKSDQERPSTFPNINRSKLSGNKAQSIIEESKQDKTLNQVLSKLSDSPEYESAQVYSIDFECGDEVSSVNQIILPIKNHSNNLVHVRSRAGTATKMSMNEGTDNPHSYQAIDAPAFESNGVIHRRIATDQTLRKALTLVRQDPRYQEWVRELIPEYHVQTQDSNVVEFPEKDRAIVIVPATVDETVDSPSPDDRLIAGFVDTETWTVTAVKDDLVSCLVNCGATKSLILGICYTDCIVLSAGVACLACLGVTAALCGYCFV